MRLRMIATAVCIVAAMLLSACGEHPNSAASVPIVTPIEIAVPILSGCVPPNIDAKPDYPDSDDALRAAPDAASRYQLLYAGRKLRVARLNELEPIVDICPKATPK